MGEAIANYLRSEAVPLVELHDCMGLLVELRIQAVPLGGLPDWPGLLTVLRSQVRPRAGFCNHLRSGNITGCVP